MIAWLLSPPCEPYTRQNAIFSLFLILGIVLSHIEGFFKHLEIRSPEGHYSCAYTIVK